MLFENKIAAFIVFVTAFRKVAGDPNFRILAPEFLCPNDEEAVIEKPDYTIITVKTDAASLQLSWTVRWTYLYQPSQLFTLLLWKSVRALEAKLNAPQPEPFVYVIDNVELLQGVEYIFSVTASQPDLENRTTKWFAIDNMKGDPKLLIEGQSDKLSVLLIGGETVYADMEYVVEAEVFTCSPTQDYYFVWSVQSSSAGSANVSDTSGSRLEIPPYSLQAGASYYVSCTVYRNSGEFVTQTVLPLQVLYRGLAVNLNLDFLVVTLNNDFDLKAVVENHDYFGQVLNFEWSCVYKHEPCDNFESTDSQILNFRNGLPNLGQYEITLVVAVQDQYASTNATINVVEPTLPVIQIEPQQHRSVNERSVITLVANASNVAPSCTLTWYFANEEHLTLLDNNDTYCDDCQMGQSLSGSVTIFSLEENFLNELTDFTNQTEWRQVVAEMSASAGRARFVAQCGCSLTFSCDTQGTAHGDVYFKLNEGPKVADVKVSPETGTAIETVFRLSTLAASDSDKPLRYTFYCSIGTNISLMLASNLEHLAVETFLPYIDANGTNLWLEVCDSLGACSSSDVKTVQLLEGEGRTMQLLVNSMRGHVKRCEMMMLRRVVESAVTTYRNANQLEVLSNFTISLLEILPPAEDNHCIKKNQDYYKLLDWLVQAGVDTTSLLE